MSFDGETVVERDATPGRMPDSLQPPVSSSIGVEHPELDDLAGHAVDFDEVADADAVLSHQHEPAEEADDEVLERDGQSGAGQPEERAEVVRWTEDDEQDE